MYMYMLFTVGCILTFCFPLLRVSGSSRNSLHSRSVRDWDTWSAAHPSVPALLLGVMPPSASLLVSSRGNESPKSFMCPRCGRGYKLKSSLRNHEKWECGMEPQFQCPYCAYRAKQKMHVARHIERMHKEKIELA